MGLEEAKRRVLGAAQQWVVREHGRDDGFTEWYWNSGRGDTYAVAYADWLASPERIERWAERHGVLHPTTRGFARWYSRTGRTDSWAEAYEVFRGTPASEIVAGLRRSTGG